jgi:hypothetical protein
VALLCERAAARFEADANALAAYSVAIRRFSDSAFSQWLAAGATPSLSPCLSPECTFVGAPAAVLMHERTVHAATAVDLHATHVAVALRHRRDPGEFRLGCLPSLGRSCWLTASLALFEVILARAGPQARNNAARHPVVKAALENPSVETARGMAKAI